MNKNLQRKIWRELWHIRAQVLAIALVIMSGVAVCLMSLSTYDSLKSARNLYYQDYHFADVFASLKRAPNAYLKNIAEIPGVAKVEGRVVAFVNLEVEGFTDPISGLINSISENHLQEMNRLYLVSGNFPDPFRDDEVAISDAFAEAQQLKPGDFLTAIINGKRKKLRISGVALSPEHIYQIAPGAMFPDYQRFGVLWMPYRALSVAYGMQGAFNDVLIQLKDQRMDDNTENVLAANQVIDELDLLLTRYGSQGAYDRRYQLSNQFLREEFAQLENMAYVFPTIFLSVAVFLLSVVVGRIINSQREIIAVLKAFGYSNLQITLHYWQMILLICFLGIVAGFGLGAWLGELMTATYTDYYRFPYLLYQIKPQIFLSIAMLTILVASLGTWNAVRKAGSLSPAEAMRPESPEIFHQTLIEKLGLQKLLNSSGRMVLRNLEKKPLKTLLTLLGLSMATAIMMVGNFQQDAVNFMIFTEFKLSQQHDVEVILNEIENKDALYSLQNIEGVLYAEGSRVIPVKLINGQKSFKTAIQGIDENAKLQKVLDTKQNAIVIPKQGILVSDHLAKKLSISEGQLITVKVLEGNQPEKQLPVAKISKQFMGIGVYADLNNLNRTMNDGDVINRVLLAIDQKYAADIFSTLREYPAVANINLRKTVIRSFEDTLERILLVFTFINALLGSVIAFGVVYNSVRIALAERGRELASLRVLGYTHAEVSSILLGELFILTLVSIPIGFVIGIFLCQFLATGMASDLFRVPLVLTSYTFSFSALVVLLSAMFSSILVWHRMKHLDLVEVLKTRE